MGDTDTPGMGGLRMVVELTDQLEDDPIERISQTRRGMGHKRIPS